MFMKRFTKSGSLNKGRFHMKKRNILLPILIGVVLIAMCLPWAYLWKDALADTVVYRPKFGLFALGLPVGNPFTTLSFVLAIGAFVFSFFSGKKPVCRILCGLLLLASAAVCVCDGCYDCFTVLTWAIFGALIVLGLWTLFFFGRKTTKAA